MESLQSQVRGIELDDFEAQIDIFTSGKVKNDEKTHYKALLKYSQQSNTSKRLFDIMQKNVDKFLKALEKLGDVHGSILVNVLTLTEEKDHWVSQVLNSLKNLLKQDQTNHEFFLSVYLAVVAEFKICFPSHLPTLMRFIVPKNDDTNIEATVLFIVVKNLELKQEETSEAVQGFFDYILEAEDTFTSFLNLVKALDCLFPLIPSVCGRIYTSNNCKDLVKRYVSQISPSSLSAEHNQTLAWSLLKLVSTSCIDDECRKFNTTNYSELLKTGKSLDSGMKILSSLCIIKLWNFLENDKIASIDDLYDIMISALKKDTHLDYCLEALAYLTLNATIRIKLRNDESAIDHIISVIKSRSKDDISNIHSSIVYGLLLILGNLMNIKEDDKQNTKSYLKSMAAPKSGDDKKEKPEDIHNFNKYMILDHKIIDILSKLKVLKMKEGATNNSQQLVYIIYSISKNQNKATRQELVKQGSINILLDYVIGVSKVKDHQTRPMSNADIETRLKAIRALTKILISVNPALAFNKYSVVTCVPFLVELLGPDVSEYNPGLSTNVGEDKYLYEEITNLDKYESLLALTNLSSMADKEVGDIIISRTFDKFLNNFIIENDIPEILKASWELISNLIINPKILVKFFNVEDKKSMTRLNLLIKLLQSEDLSLQTILAGLLANATESFDMISQVLVENTDIKVQLTNNIASIFSHQPSDTDLILRLSLLLLDIIYAAANISTSQLGYFRAHGQLKSSIAEILKVQKDKQILEVVMEIIKFVKFN
ncbi:SWI5-dependent HO expression protein 4 [[Candida] jaroonii]|uniref:SWI5-dependent HO expression protein 4 n=1 Tax=[Candida] jaroonii TaxID=467808 RepID=A0ACA9Y9W7_9ASCO|nr:SWI5-dependent HO expression protein 4 [[Candida] jaroonii]